MNRIGKIAKDRRVKTAMAGFGSQVNAAVELAIAVQQVAAPTFAEEERAAFVRQRFDALGLQNVQQDVLHNVYARIPGQTTSSTRSVVVSAHLDTVFPADTDLSVHREDDLVHGPGIADNSTGVAGLLLLGKALLANELALPADVWLVANVGEEGLGDLKGMREVAKRFGSEAIYIVVEGGLFGCITHQGIGVRRFRIEVKAAGGHSWGSFGNTSAIHELGHIIAAFDALDVPEEPKTTYNVGVIEGGTTVNSIAQSASLLLDLRSSDPDSLSDLIYRVEDIVNSVDAKEDVSVVMSTIGNRPAGLIAKDSALVTWAADALHFLGCDSVEYLAGSTDANIPLSLGYDAVCIGLANSANTHRTDEYMDVTNLPNGLRQLLLLTLAAAEFH